MNTLSNIDWKLLREQKLTVGKILKESEGKPILLTEPQREHLSGLLHVCDWLEDEVKPKEGA